MLKSMGYATVLFGVISGIIGLGFWINTGSNIALAFAVGLVWICASAIFYYIGEIK